jgi:hypothetical protein
MVECDNLAHDAAIVVFVVQVLLFISICACCPRVLL